MNNIRKYLTKNIFISSTFVDMQLERDVLSKRVLPLVKEHALKYYINIEFVDLRFGIDIGNKNLLDKVINTCSDEIDRCKPLFIAFLGNRFGTKISDSDESITSLEIHHAINENCECLYYFRNILNYNELKEDYSKYFSSNDEVLKLKNELINKYPDKCKNYNVMYDENKKSLIIDDDFINELVNDINSLIDLLYANEKVDNVSPQYEYLALLNKDYIDINNKIFLNLKNPFKYNDKIILLYGESGSGKSMLLSELIKSLDNECLVIPCFTAATQDENSSLTILNSYIETLSSLENLKYEYINNLDKAIDVFYNLLSKVKQKTIFILDEFDQLKNENNNEKYSWIKLNNIPSNIRFIITTNSELDLQKLKLESYIINFNTLDDDKIKTYLDNYLIKINQKVSNEFYQMLLIELKKKSNNKTIFHLKSYLDYIFYNDRFDAEKINELSLSVKDNSLTSVDKGVLDFYTEKIRNMEENISLLIPNLYEKKLELFNKDLANAILSLICFSNFGIREDDLKKICQILNINYVSSEFAYMRKVMPSFFYQQSDGAWKFRYNLVKDTFKEYYLKNKNYVSKIQDAFLRYLLTLDYSDEIKQANIIPLLLQNRQYQESKNMLLYMINNESRYLEMIKYFLTISLIEDNNLLVELLSDNNEAIAEFIGAKVFPLISKIDLGLIYDSILTLNLKNDSKSNAIKYIFTKVLAILCLKLDETDKFDLVRQNFYSLYFETNNKDIKNDIIDFYFKAIKKYQLQVEKVSDLIIEVTRLIKRSKDKDKLYYENLCKAYLEYIKINKNNIKLINDHIKHIIKYINEGNVSTSINDEFIDLMFELVITEYYQDNFIKASKYIKTILTISDKYRYNERSLISIEKSLIMKYFNLIIKYKNNLLTVIDIDNLLEEFNYLYTKSKSLKSKFYILALEEMKLSSSLTDFENLNDYEKLILERRSLFNSFKYSNLEIYSLVYSYVELMALNFHNKDNLDASSKNKKLLIYKDIYELIKNNFKDDLFILIYKKEILFYLALLEEGLNKITYMGEEIELSIRLFKDKKSNVAIVSLVNDCFYYKDMIIENGNYKEAIEIINKVKECISYYNLSTSIFLYKEMCLLETFEMNLKLKDDVYSCFTNLSKIFSYIKNLEKENLNIVLSANLDVLDNAKNIIEQCNDDSYKRLYNKLFDELSVYCKDYLDYNGYQKYIVEESKKIDLNSSEEELKKFYFENLDKSASFDEIEKLLDLDTNENIIISYEDKETSYDEIKHLCFSEKYHNRYDKNIVANSEIEFWQLQIEKGYLIGYYNLAYLFEKNKQLDEALEIYEVGARQGCIACMDALGHFYKQLGRIDESYNILVKSATRGYLYAIERLIENYKERLAEENKFELLMKPIYNNLMSYGNNKINLKVLDLAKLCIEYGELDIEKYYWFIKYYNYLTKTKTGNIIKYLPTTVNEINKNEITIFNLLKDAVVNNNADAMAKLAYHYYKGDIINVNYAKGLDWTVKAANNKNYSMCFYTGMLLYTGDSTLEIDYNRTTTFLLLSFVYSDGKEHGVEDTLRHIYNNKLCNEETLKLIENYIK